MRRPRGWTPPGPVPPGPVLPGLEAAPGETLDCLSGHWKIFQLRKGHRYSTDDLLTAWFAAEAARVGGRKPHRYLDLGCGIGSVGLLVLWQMPTLRMVGVEAQHASAALARRSLRYNGVADRAEIRGGDFRDSRLLSPGERFDLITGSPPYLRAAEGRRSTAPQRGPCRFEDRGDVRAYLQVAARHLAPGGDFIWCHATRHAEACREAARDVGLEDLVSREVLFREGKESLISLFRARRRVRGDGAAVRKSPLVIRDRYGKWGEEYREIRRRMGFPAF